MTIALSRLNFRDIGGLRSANGQTVRPGLIYRSEGPASFLENHRAELLALNIGTVCDLRSAVERSAAPNDWCGPDCRILNLDMNTDLRAQGKDIWESLRVSPTSDTARAAMSENYRMMPAAIQPHLSLMVDALLEGRVPLLVHCTAGKDRTGVIIAILLLLLNVPLENIIEDYSRSDVFGENMRIAGSIEQGFNETFGFVASKEVVDMMIGTVREFLLAALAEIDTQWGGIEQYFQACGIDANKQARLRAELLEPATQFEEVNS
ncbi:MAG: protein-tyrosine phosphatase [Sphingomonadales bacterium]|nr:protein-tyrosine phosphatase [Sphingomonadales bacterium]